MVIGGNVNLKDRLIKKTTHKTSNDVKENNKSNELIMGRRRGEATHGTMKATFYTKKDLLQKLYNFAYWERYNITEAFNIILADGLKGKNTKNKGE